MIDGPAGAMAPIVRLRDVALRYGKKTALDSVSLDIPSGRMVGLIGPDGVGKSSLLSLIAGARAVQTVRVEVLDGDMANAADRRKVEPSIADMPQGLGKNLYPTRSVLDNIDVNRHLFAHIRHERARPLRPLNQ